MPSSTSRLCSVRRPRRRRSRRQGRSARRFACTTNPMPPTSESAIAQSIEAGSRRNGAKESEKSEKPALQNDITAKNAPPAAARPASQSGKRARRRAKKTTAPAASQKSV